jgi:hypothetical protein
MTRFLTILSLSLSLLPACKRGPSFAFEEAPQSLGSHTGDPVALVRPSGHLVELGTESVAEGQDLFVWHSHGGDEYRRGEKINDVSGEVTSRAEATPQLLSGPGMRVCALWLFRSGGQAGLRVRCSRDFGEHWQPAVTVPTGTSRAPSFFAGAISPGGAIVVTWFAFEEVGQPGSAQLWLASSRDGVSFTAGRRVALDVCPCCRPALKSGPGTLYLAYRHVGADGCRDIVARTSADEGGTWTEPVAVSQDNWKIDGCPHSGPALAVDGERLVVAWLTEVDGRNQLFWTESRDRALHFAPRNPLSKDALDPNHPSLVIEGGHLFAAFEARDPAKGNGWGPRRAWLLDVDSQSLRSVPESGGASYPTLAPLSAGAVLISWTQREGEESRARLSRLRIQRGG